jgi:hypothetical protein
VELVDVLGIVESQLGDVKEMDWQFGKGHAARGSHRLAAQSHGRQSILGGKKEDRAIRSHHKLAKRRCTARDSDSELGCQPCFVTLRLPTNNTNG